MHSPPSIIRKRFVSLLFLIQYTTAANDSGLQADYQEDSLASLPLTSLDNTLPAASGPSQFIIPFTSGSATSEPYPDPQDGNDPKPFLLSSNEYCNSAAGQPYTSHRKRRKRQNGKTFCDNNDSTPGGASHQLLENNEIPKPKSPAQNSAPNPNGRGKIPNKNQPPINEGLHSFLYSMPGWDGEPNPAACNNPDYPLLQVPVCAPPAPQSIGRTSPAEYVVPCKFSKFFAFHLPHSCFFCATYT